MNTDLLLGLDVGSTTVKAVVLDNDGAILFSRYMRHNSEVHATVAALLSEVNETFPETKWRMSVAGSGAITLAEKLNISFVQEVIASSLSIRTRLPETDVAIELGGEDAKLTFFRGGLDQRMNETCAGGTGAFIDQMAAFIQTDAAGLDALAQKHTTIYPIASRCGVFAKTDILPLLNEGGSREDIAASIMQAVVNQTISGLARGRAIEGKVVFLGGPLTFLPSLRDRFVKTLKLAAEDALFPEHAEFFVAIGAALHARETEARLRLDNILWGLETYSGNEAEHTLPALFRGPEDKKEFIDRHSRQRGARLPLDQAHGSAWLGFDSGSTTLKAVLIDAKGRLLYSYYGPNKGNPLSAAIKVLEEIYEKKNPDLFIEATAVTGYGSALLKAGLCADIDEVETVAHLTAARFFEPKVSFILDIGGQDIKCMYIKNGAIDQIQLNEACSAGCGSFLENFAASLGISLADFVDLAMNAKKPVDLGTRCTVFMNSKVKQAQKEGASVADIAAGLCYSVIRNACYKVMKISNVAELGEHIVVQGGSFFNNALLRVVEMEISKHVTRPGIAGLMGAFGAALIACERGSEQPLSRLIGPEEVASFSTKTATARCKHCSNSCLLTITTFADKRRFISGNRCERGNDDAPQNLPNMYAYKYRRLFEHYVPLDKAKAKRGVIGIPRALNIFENYPLWFTLFTTLGYRVELSAPTSKSLFFKGFESIPSQTVCYPAKLAHGHIVDLVERGVDAIFFPCITFEQKDFDTQTNNYNCPVVTGYPELLARNVPELARAGIPLIHEFLPLSKEMLGTRLKGIPFFARINSHTLDHAIRRGFDAMEAFKKDIREQGEKVLRQLKESGTFGVVVTGHPYHTDPGVHHGIAELITSCGMGVLTEDSVAHLMPDPGTLRVVDQWTYHSRLYRAGAFAASRDNLAVLQLVSFGCGLDAITMDQLQEIVTDRGRLYAQIKIDEGANLGPARIRIRSLYAALRERKDKKMKADTTASFKGSTVFTKAMRKTHTILVPQLSPIHFNFIETIIESGGYKVKQLPSVNRDAIDLGLRYVNNDACFPAIVMIGQLLQAVQSGEYDPNRIALLISETGGGCRATNYIAFLRKALADCGMDHIPIISFFISAGDAKESGFEFTGSMLRKAIMAAYYGDALMRLLHRVRPYEAEEGSANALAAEWTEKGKEALKKGGVINFDKTLWAMIRAFDKLPLVAEEKRKPRVGLVGEIMLKYHPDANNEAAKIVEQEGGEAVVPDIMDFVLYCLYDRVFAYKQLAGRWRPYIIGLLSIMTLEFCRLTMRIGLGLSKRFTAPSSFRTLRKKTKGLISMGHQTGEGWLLTAEMVKMLEADVPNILCMQPFGCLPNHITAKGWLKELKNRFPEANIMAVDYDPGASEVNQINRIKLMMSTAK
ncbi:BadF/BadG/BcrA/BcrD ATPase family protein [uncultured delta proteobacterium]|uniref:BadF/BadG/BcrA/BcrD ATPase family protein n=1 Tax=uncultured delta proteobacterium TaxID=34034 RepID=A0A212KF62_9DELT|nr:BadF/BadG/BcrA/BcrD ATPase family protein [uncultured delta proteobacterium]